MGYPFSLRVLDLRVFSPDYLRPEWMLLWFCLILCISGQRPALAEELPAPLPASVFHTNSKAFLPFSEFLVRLQDAQAILLGELHDNAVHHQLQAKIAGELSPGLALIFEMVPVIKSEILKDLSSPVPGHLPADLAEQLEWESSGWPDFSFYEPLFELAPKRGVKLFAGNLSRLDIRAIAKQDITRTHPLFDRLNLRGLPPAHDDEGLLDELFQAHCEAVPREHLYGMAAAQQAVDAHFALQIDQALQHPEIDRAILIAGRGHVRRDRGVPFHLLRRQPDHSVVSIGLLEESEGLQDATLYDYVIVTPQAERKGDLCDLFRRS